MKNMVKVKTASMDGGAAGGLGRLEKSMAVGGSTPGSMDGKAKKPVTMGDTKISGSMGGMPKNAPAPKRKL
jgi:hypothetical protein